MKLWKKCLSGILTTAMLVGLVPTSALAVHAPGTDTGDLGLAQEVSLFINETNPDDELQSADALGYSRTPYNNEESYPYVIPITEGQNTADIYSKARVTMSSQTAQHLMNDVQNLDVEQTRFVVFMAIDENMTLTFSFPSEPHSFPKDLTVTGMDKLEGNTYMNKDIPGHESG